MLPEVGSWVAVPDMTSSAVVVADVEWPLAGVVVDGGGVGGGGTSTNPSPPARDLAYRRRVTGWA